MTGEVIVRFGDEQDFRFAVAPQADGQNARAWLDEQFLVFDCEPTRASGKVLVADKLLAIAEAAGPAEFGDAAWAQRFAAAALAATGRSLVSIDVAGNSVNY